MSKEPYETYAWLGISDFGNDPSLVTKVIGLDPSESYVKGDPWRGEVKRFSSAWILKSPADKTESLEEILGQLFEILRTQEAGVIEAGQRFSAEIGVAAYFRQGLPIMNLSSVLVKQIADYGCSLDIDTYQL